MNSPRPAPPAFISREVTQARRFYLNLNPRKTMDFLVLCGGWERCAQDYEIKRRGLPHHVVEFVAGGEGWLELDGRRHELRRGVAFAYGPEAPHRIRTHPERRLSKYFLYVAGTRCHELLEKSRLTSGACRMVAEPEAVEHAFDELVLASLGGGRFVTRVSALLAEVLLLKMAERPTSRSSRQGSWQTFARCRAYMDEHFLELASAEAAAQACHVDPTYLSRLFARHGCEPPYRYLLRRKMAFAAELLHDGRVIVREVADRLGMDPFQFSKAFKRTYGIAPAKFLARHKGLPVA